MRNQFLRSLMIFRLAASFLVDYWKIRRHSTRSRSPQRDEAIAKIYAKSGERVRLTALRMQGLIVKVGQFLSTRTDILPLAFTRELTQLQDAVPGVEFVYVKPAVERELGAPIASLFQSFEAVPLAAASLGQVHRAELSDGQVVAVKVLRPDIEHLAAIDLAALRRVVRIMHRFTRFGKRMNITAIYREFAQMVSRELDYRHEAANLKRFQLQFADNQNIVIPRLHDTYTTQRVLVMEFIEGVKVTDVEGFSARGILPQDVVNVLLDAYLRQLLVRGFVHVDPHPGNLLILSDGRVCFLDFGMMSEIDPMDVRAFAKLVSTAMMNDLDGVVQAIDDLGFLQPYADRAILKKAVGFMLDRINGLKLKRGPELQSFIEQFQDFLHDEPIVVQAKYMFLGRAMGILAGLLTNLHPKLDWIAVLKDRALPLLSANAEASGEGSGAAWRKNIRSIAKLIWGDTGAATADLVVDQLQSSALSIVRVPGQLERVLNKAEQGDLTIRLELRQVLERLEFQERLIKRVIWLVLAVTGALVGLWLDVRGHRTETEIAFSLMGVFLMMVLVNSWSSRRRRRFMNHRIRR